MHMKSQCSVCACACVRAPFSTLEPHDRSNNTYFYINHADVFLRPSKKCKKELLPLLHLSVYPFTWNNFVPTVWTFMKFDTSIFRESVVKI